VDAQPVEERIVGLRRAAIVPPTTRLVEVLVEDRTGGDDDVHGAGVDQVADHPAQPRCDERAGEPEIDGRPAAVGEHALEHPRDAAERARLDAGVGVLRDQVDHAGAAPDPYGAAGSCEDGPLPLPLLGREGGKAVEAAAAEKRLHAGCDVARSRRNPKTQWSW